ncbi:telomerase reverse transcriptase-like [Saccostrea echinata]|uniref:telomerase reverse transcriptase-like n=1 Tax=Saccostrea echinata TaxID=191078 RepID=UPI002A822215|nr:telomerase reverse transcriptase-like [Saccostrea echinata]
MDIIRSMFTFALPLQEWLKSFGSVCTEGDSNSYLRNLETTIVAFNVDVRDKLVITSSPPSETKELVLRVIEKLLRQGETNVLTLGFGMMSDDPDAQVSCFTNIEYRHPNSSVNLLHQGVWKRLHQCIGDVWMRALLEETAIFTLCSESCYIQVTGIPIFVKVKSAGGILVSNGSLEKSKKSKLAHHEPQADEQTKRKQCRKRKRTEDSELPKPKKVKLQEYVNPTEKGIKQKEQSPSFNPYKYHLYMSQSYLYSADHREKFPAAHPLSNPDPCLYKEIYSVDVRDDPKVSLPNKGQTAMTPMDIPPLPSLEELLGRMHDNHKSCRYLAFLHTCCPVSSAKKRVQKTGRRNRSTPTHVLLQDYAPPQKVYIFLRKVFITVIPEKLLGCKQNRNCFLKSVKKLIYLGRYEKICLGEIMKGIKTKSVSWLPKDSQHCLKLNLLSTLVYWLMNTFIITLIKAFFYVTETAVYRNQRFFYRKKVWSKLHNNGIQDLKRRGILSSIKKSEVIAALQRGDCLGEATIRFLPKLRSLRPIANLGRQPPTIAKSTLPINKQLMNVLTVLSYLTSCDPSSLGSAAFGTDDIFSAWKHYVMDWKRNPKRKSLYFVKMDISSCFDGISQEKLLCILDNMLSKAPDEDVIIRKFVSHYVSDGKVVCKFKKIASSFGEYIPDFEKFVKKFAEDSKLSNMVFVNQMINQQMHLEETFEKLKCHILNNIIKIGRQYFKQTTGISQGSVLSTLLCNLYYGHMERTFLPPQKEELLMRMVDDSLFVTPSRERAEMFLCKMIQGNTEYNFSINTDKVLVNFVYEHESCGIMKRNVGEWFPWCGLLLNTATLEVGNDLTRYEGIRMRYTLTVDVSSSPGLTMKRKLLMSLRPKCHAIFLDTELNSLEVCLSNSYRLLLLTAFKFHCYASCLPEKQRVTDNPGFFHAMINDIGSYICSQAALQCKRKFRDSFIFDVPKRVMEWLCWYAFLMKMKCHSSSYKELIQMINKSLKRTEKLLHAEDKHACVALRRLCGQIPVELKIFGN